MQPLRSLAELEAAAWCRRAVYVPSLLVFAKPRPAAWIMRLQAYEVQRLLEAGMYLYESAAAKKKKMPND